MGLLGNFRDVAQGASNGAASTVTNQVDLLAWMLRHAGVPVGDTPVGGSDWAKQQGLVVQPQNKNYGLLGESVGGLLPMMAPAKSVLLRKSLE